ncbi:coiled-coil domain-containing protein 81-like isoform X2 [Falco naumanni]|uniref:coiled-coil domain-containing protein 81-like isoform X2 n=1 Tax=Falco naumanni TaxID=148594 RepID=UPI001ADE3D59|nr:coiled-coil domain-containing protein 81-like isoform X2 [Falco naumanni]
MSNISQPAEQITIWDAVASYVRQQLLLHKGVRIPTLGYFDVVPTQMQVGTKTVTLHKPIFCLSRVLRDIHNLTDNRDDLSDNKVLEPVKYAEVAADADVSRRKVEICILGTTSLLSQCLGKGKSIALVLRDIGLLLIEDKKVEMRFYYDFLEGICGKRNLRMAALSTPWLLDTVVSPMVPVASLTRSGCVIIFPEFELQLALKSRSKQPLKVMRHALGEGMWRKEEDVPPAGQDAKAGSPGSSSAAGQPEEPRGRAWANMGTTRRVGRLPDISGARSQKTTTRSQPRSQLAGKGQAQAAKEQRRKRKRGEATSSVGSKPNGKTSASVMPEAWVPEELVCSAPAPPPTRAKAAQRQQSRPGRFWMEQRDARRGAAAEYVFTTPYAMVLTSRNPR